MSVRAETMAGSERKDVVRPEGVAVAWDRGPMAVAGEPDDRAARAEVESAVCRQALIRGLVERRKQLGIAQIALASTIGTSQAHIARLENGGADPKMSTLERYAAAVGVTLDWASAIHQDQVHARAVASRSRRDASAELVQADELRSNGQVEAARAAYERAMESGIAQQAARAATSLGALLAEQGDVVGARAAFEQAIDSGQREWAPHAAVELGRLLVDQGDVEGARAAFHVATRSDHYDWAARARRHLLELSPGPRRR